MQIGPYSIVRELPGVLLRNFADAVMVRFVGIPRLPGDTPQEIATAVMVHNAQEVLNAGQGHFVYMWPSDFGKAIKGALHVLPESYLQNLIEEMILESVRMGYVPSCFSYTRNFHGFDMPYPRADNLPWLVHALYTHARATGEDALIHRYKKELQQLIATWEETHMEHNLIKNTVRGDWMDTILRPSSTYNNLCALYLLQLAAKLGIETLHNPNTVGETILKSRLREGYFIDYDSTTHKSIDASVLTLYLELFDVPLRQELATVLADSPEIHPYPIRCTKSTYPHKLISPIVRYFPNYHDGIWLHLGLMYLNGIKKLGMPTDELLADIDELTMRYGNMIETLTPRGKLYTSLLHATEYGLTMTAGQYLELTVSP